MKQPSSRRAFLKMTTSLALTAPMATPMRALAAPGRVVVFADDRLRIEFDNQMRSRIALVTEGKPLWLTGFDAGETLSLVGGHDAVLFELRETTSQAINDRHGPGRQVRLTGLSGQGIEKTLTLRQYARYPGVAFMQVSYRNITAKAVAATGWRNGAHRLLPPGLPPGDPAPAFWSYSGGTYADRRDWLQPVKAGFAQDNYLGMSSSDYGGGPPIADLWRREGGLAVGHLAPVPELVSLPVSEDKGGARLALTAERDVVLAPGGTFDTLETLLAVHAGDYFAALDAYRRIAADRGVRPPQPSAASFEPIWCAWGYERSCTPELIEATLPKAKELGLDWAVIDDGWQKAIGDWVVDPAKYPGREADFLKLVGSIRQGGLKPRLWYAPLAAAPGSDLLHDHTDMLLLSKEGAPQLVTWWNSFYLCPAYEPTRAHTVALVRKFLGDWGFKGLKIDGQHLNGVAPCYNPAHNHARPEESVEALPGFFRAIYEAAMAIDKDNIVELCPCGTAYSVYDFPYVNQVPASDPESSWQVRLKGKTLKALMGPSAPFAGDHVELSDGGDDFASTVGIGGIVSTKFTWPVDPKPKDSFLLTPEREAHWKKWIGLYRDKRLAEGLYRGDVYDIGFDKPEGHLVESGGRYYYAFYAPHWSGPLTLRGLPAGGRFRVRDYVEERDLGLVPSAHPVLTVSFEKSLLLEVSPA
ncbi:MULTISPECIES: glycoside hydrolase family 36 protein [Nitrospirillum]|uniref:Alpha-galactosidase n=1 Tax=Nitrospirillum amazonense TaxID=28077 RepID=A0A560G358_9PROT|nr:glycoside hydrolase family 36 protein [Nitrospirillum amazonense]MEC4591933.1 glycoside hydrolase family 36 protein [Nitrospirillum amazonense]TWB28327.1 alpha-galactosidase [Nitrospirillum amazonense]